MLHTIQELLPCAAGLQSVRIKTRFIAVFIFSDLADNQKDFRDTHAVLQ